MSVVQHHSYVSAMVDCPGAVDYFFFPCTNAVGYKSLNQWRIEKQALGSFDIIEVIMGEWGEFIDSKRSKTEVVYRRGMTSKAATARIARLCVEKPGRHFVKRRRPIERSTCGRPVARTCNMSTEDCCRYTGRCYCGRVTPQGALECVDCMDYRGWFR